MRKETALQKFARSIGRPILRWGFYRTAQPLPWRRWRTAYSVARRFEMYFAAGLLEASQRTLFERLYAESCSEERRTWAAWREYKRRLEAQYLAGRRKKCPKWCSC